MVDSYPWPRDYYDGFQDESEYSDWLKYVFEKMNWRVRREVTATSGKSRADIIAAHRKWGTFGIECKPDLRPRNVADAINKISRYAGERFRGFTVDGWCIAVARRKTSLKAYNHDRPVTDDYYVARQGTWQTFASQLANCLGIGWLSHSGGMEIVFNESNPMVKIPIADVSYPSGELESFGLSHLQDRDRPQLKKYIDKNRTLEVTDADRTGPKSLAEFVD